MGTGNCRKKYDRLKPALRCSHGTARDEIKQTTSTEGRVSRVSQLQVLCRDGEILSRSLRVLPDKSNSTHLFELRAEAHLFACYPQKPIPQEHVYGLVKEAEVVNQFYVSAFISMSSRTCWHELCNDQARGVANEEGWGGHSKTKATHAYTASNVVSFYCG